jgi:hypothetical protein
MGLLLQVLHHFRAGAAIRIAGIVVHLGGLGELATGQWPFDHHRFQVGTRSVDGGGKCGGAPIR